MGFVSVLIIIFMFMILTAYNHITRQVSYNSYLLQKIASQAGVATPKTIADLLHQYQDQIPHTLAKNIQRYLEQSKDNEVRTRLREQTDLPEFEIEQIILVAKHLNNTTLLW